MAKRKPKTPKSTSKPFIVRPGARYTCFNDGLCCTDIHALGPITRTEARDVRNIDPAGVFMNEDVEDLCLKPVDGLCHFQRDGLCQVHAQHGPELKPAGCRRFPYGLVKTPVGGRITTEHRCPCRTLGDRPEIDLEDAEASLKDRAGRLEADNELEARIQWSNEKSIRFDEYVERESELLQRLADGERAEDVLGVDALCELDEGSWSVYAAEFFDMRDGTAGGEALCMFGDALLELSAGHTPPERLRPWAGAFDRAIARCTKEESPEVLYNDWIADEIWMFRWDEWGAFDTGRKEMATRLAVARKVQERLQALGLRADQATAEAIMVVETATVSSEWPKAAEAISED